MTAADIAADQPLDGTAGAVPAMLDYVGRQGLMAPATSNATKTGFLKVIEIEGEHWTDVNLREVDEDQLFARFRRLRANIFSDGTKAAYCNRFHRAKAMHLARVDDDSDWVNAGRESVVTAPPRGRTAKRPAKPAAAEADDTSATPLLSPEMSFPETSTAERVGPAMPDWMQEHTYYLTDELYAVVRVPKRLTGQQAAYLSRILVAQAVPDARPPVGELES